jgi:hypothetical protein
MTSDKFKFNCIISWIFLYLGFQLCMISNLRSYVFEPETSHALNVFMNYGAVAMALGIIFLSWSIFLNLKISFKRSHYQENNLKLWKIVCFSWIGLITLPFLLIYLLDVLSQSYDHVEYLAMFIPFIMLAFFGLLQAWAFMVGGKTPIYHKVKSS